MFATICQVNQCTLEKFGTTIRQLRENKRLFLRQVAAELDIDTALLSKVERGSRSLKKEQVIRIAKIIGASEKHLIVLWLSEKITDLIQDEKYAEQALSMSLNLIKDKNNYPIP